MRIVLSLFLIAFAIPTYIATTRYVRFGTWQNIVLLFISVVSVWYSGILMSRAMTAKRFLKMRSDSDKESLLYGIHSHIFGLRIAKPDAKKAAK